MASNVGQPTYQQVLFKLALDGEEAARLMASQCKSSQAAWTVVAERLLQSLRAAPTTRFSTNNIDAHQMAPFLDYARVLANEAGIVMPLRREIWIAATDADPTVFEQRTLGQRLGPVPNHDTTNNLQTKCPHKLSKALKRKLRARAIKHRHLTSLNTTP